ncbi:hypothetical protein BV25DRAFT_1910389 [Artomyces pyxidatus]|uniref:Uncharacterized protein n=1 Tax=Artomyces pyxidatus TaxID=48021 RepID=A0ACB8TJJ8_9AGAM|nr:hypothetical protein BV25DRAFT_1910389 [Artomyces pyxidatus]
MNVDGQSPFGIGVPVFNPEAWANKVFFKDDNQGLPTSHGKPSEAQIPKGWERYVHMTGTVYYYHPKYRFLATDDLTNWRTRVEVEDLGKDILYGLKEDGLLARLPDDMEVVISNADRLEGPTATLVSYKAGVKFVYQDGDSETTPYEITVWPKVSFWLHVEGFPMHRNLSPNAETEFLSALAHSANEHILGHKKTTARFTDAESRRLLEIYTGLKKVLSRRPRSGALQSALAWHVGRVMFEVERYRACFAYGTKDARKFRAVESPEVPGWVGIVEKFLCCVLFGVHQIYRGRLERMHPTVTAFLPDFHRLMEGFIKEWGDANLLATVFVSANVGFLAIPPEITTAQRTASLTSILFAVFCIVTGVHHIWRHRLRVHADYEDVPQYFGENLKDDKETYTDTTLLACFLSLPIVSLLWSILSFTVAISAFCVQGKDLSGKIVISTSLGILVVSAVTTVYFFENRWRGESRDDGRSLRPHVNGVSTVWNALSKKLGRRTRRILSDMDIFSR